MSIDTFDPLRYGVTQYKTLQGQRAAAHGNEKRPNYYTYGDQKTIALSLIS